MKRDTPRHLPITTVLALRQARIGQGKFRADLIQRWGGACSVTGWGRTELLWAAHIKPWSRATTVEKIHPDNGLLLSPILDSLFEARLITFDDDGRMLVAEEVSKKERRAFDLPRPLRVAPTSQQRIFLRLHLGLRQCGDWHTRQPGELVG